MDTWNSIGTLRFGDIYSEIRASHYGVDGVVPAEFLARYLRTKTDSKRKYIVFKVRGQEMLALAKHVRMFNVNFLRLEGLPVPFSGHFDKTLVIDGLRYLHENSLFHKVRMTTEEYFVFRSVFPDVGVVFETDIANFVIDVPKRVKEISSSTWRAKHGINKAKTIGGVVHAVADTKDAKDIMDLFVSWVKFKKQTESIMHKGLYTGLVDILSSVGTSRDVLFDVLRFDGRLVGASAHIVSGDKAHLIMNVSAHRTLGHEIPERFNVLVRNIGYLMYFHGLARMNSLGLKHALFGWCSASDPLVQFKTNMSHQVTRLHISDFVLDRGTTVNVASAVTSSKKGFGLGG